MKRYLMPIVALCMATVVQAAVTTHLKLDCRSSSRTVSLEGETLLYDIAWYEGGSEVRITDNGVVLTNGTAGSYFWSPEQSCQSQHTLKLEALSVDGQVIETETADFIDRRPTLEHTEVVSKPAVAPSSGTAGSTAEIICSKCGEVIQAATEIPALGYIRNVTARQLWPHGKVEVCYDLAEDIGEVANVETPLMLTGTYGSITRKAHAILGDTTCQPGIHRVVWDVEEDGMNRSIPDFRVAVGYGTVSNAVPSIGFELIGNNLANLVYRWSFNGNLEDSVRGITAQYLGSEDIARASDNKAISLAGGSRGRSGVNLGANLLPIDGSSITIEVWAKARSKQGTCNRVLEIGNDKKDSLQLMWWTNPDTLSEAQLRNEGSIVAGACTSWNAFAVGIDYHVAVRIEPNDSSTTISIIRRIASSCADCEEINWTIDSGWHLSDLQQDVFYLGRSLWSDNDSAADYDEVRIWNSALTNVELQQNVLSGPDAIPDFDSVTNGLLHLCYSPIDAGEASIEIDSEEVLSATNGGTFVWQPLTKGEHTITHIAGTNVWTRTVNVTSLVYEEPTPNPPTAEDANFTITTTVRALTSTAKTSGVVATAKVDSSYSGTWSATTSADWITLTYATRNVGLPVIYTVAENKGVEARTGYVYVSGHVFTITQPGVGGSLDAYSADVGSEGGEAAFTVTVDSSASWRARSNVDWISVETLCGTGECEVVYHVAPWNEVSTRSGTITAASCTFTVNQTGREMRLSTESVEKDYLPHDIVLAVDALASTEWGIALDASWLSIVERGSGKGAGTVTLAINENPSYSNRTATALIGTETFTIVQTGRPTAALAFAISPEATTASVKGANGVISVEATPDLPWSATSQTSWLTVMPGFSSGAGNGNVVYAATPNSTMAERSGTIRVSPEVASGVAAKTHTVTQPAATAMLSIDNHTFAVDGDSFAVEVSVDDVVAWTIVENVDWLSMDGTTSRNGPDSVTIAVEPNMSIEPREATITIAGHEFHVTQLGRTISLEYGETVFPPDEFEEATIEVHPNGEVEWTAVPSDATWISVWSEDENCVCNADGSVSGIGDATLKYMVTAYVGDGGVKTGWITIGNEKIFVSQRAYELSIDPCATNVAGNAGAGSVAVPATAGQVWNAIATEPWIKLVGSYDEVTGSGTVNYTFTDNDTGETRTGKIIIAGEEYTITQAARQLVKVEVEVEGGGEVEVEKVGEGEERNVYSFDRGTTVELTAVASNDWRFVRWEKDGSAVGDGTPTLPVTADVDQEIVAVFERIPVYTVNGESVVEGAVKSFVAPDPVVMGGTTQLVCIGTSAYPNKGTSFQMQVTGNIDFDWDLWQTNYLVAISQTAGGTVSGTTGWVAAGTEVTFTATPAAGKSLYRWSGFDGGRGATALPSVSSPVLRPMTISAAFGTFADTLATAADAPSLTFTTGGEAAWTPVIDATAETGYSSIRSGAIGTESESWVETTVFSAGTLAFRWKTDCEHDDGGEATWDRLAVFVNGVEKARLDGTTSWQSIELPITDAKTVIRWSFYRDDYDASDAAQQNCSWIDGVEVK